MFILRPIVLGSAFNSCTACKPMLDLFHSGTRLLFALLALSAGQESAAQFLVTSNTLRGNGILQTCDTSMHVAFTTELLDDYACQFTPQITPGATQVNNTAWHYYSGLEWETAYGSPTIPYFSGEPYPMCLSVDAFDQVASQPCSTVVCKVVTPLPHAVCAQLVAGFSIGTVQGNSITFINESQFAGGQITGAFWSFGDGSALAAAPSPTHVFTGNGPFRICLTVVGAPPTNCSATVCQWLYMGPGGLTCGQLVSQGFAVLQHHDLVGVLDTSITSGMNHRIDWDFGDGAHATGTVAVHAYAPFQSYDLCGTLKAWGPLLADTCVSTFCQKVYPTEAVGMVEAEAERTVWAWPSPFNERLSVRTLSSGGELFLYDGLGRKALSATLAPGNEAYSVDASALTPGCYVAVLSEGGQRRFLRLVRNP
jgi:hypothetical protein